jgi:hypothetical protein
MFPLSGWFAPLERRRGRDGLSVAIPWVVVRVDLDLFMQDGIEAGDTFVNDFVRVERRVDLRVPVFDFGSYRPPLCTCCHITP